ncbi:hypothetical protein [Streptomyces sp. TLI_185]|uniref:hypothetical protein n=1 Tax=Streptomyces sp. TLI_185 TaxID=2485151 RepID=UPI00160DCB01|nr:hypothetical protein [Streptomyces sp. TLI_185]
MAGALEQDWAAPGQLHETVQIGVLRLHEDFSVHEEFTPPTRGRELEEAHGF